MSLKRRLLQLLAAVLASASLLILATPLAAQTPVNLGNFVWDDRDGDGAQDAGEPGLAGITVQLWNSTKTQVLGQTLSNSNGNYTVQAPGPGTYRVRVVLPTSNSQFSPKDQAGGDDLDDSDFNSSGTNLGFTDIISIASNVISISNIDCGLLVDRLPGHTIGNRVFRAQPDGTQPALDAALGFVGTVELLSSTGTVLQTTTTQPLGLNRGYYGFNAPPGTYRLRFIGSAGYIPTPYANAGGDDAADSDIDGDGLTSLLTLNANQVRTDLDAGFVLPVNLGNFVWDDRDGDGAQDAGEPGLAGIIVQLWNATKTQVLGQTLSNSNGNYTVQAPGPGTYRVRVVLPTVNSEFSPMNQAGGDDLDDSDFNSSGTSVGFTDIISIASNVISISNIDCGLLVDRLPGHTIGNRVFRAQPDGTQPALDATLGFVGTVELLSSTGTVLQTTTTQPLGLNRGYYGFNAPPGTYRLRFIGSASYIPTPYANAGGDDAADSDIDANGLTALFTLSAGQVLTDLDAGFVLPITIGNRVWQDQNGNGVQDLLEPGVPDVVVELWNSGRTRRWDAAVTNASGTYSLQAPGPGDYRVWVLRPLATDTFSPPLQGGNVTTDSNIIASGADLGFTDVFSIASNVISISNIDAGLQFAPGRRAIPPLRVTAYNRLAGTLSFTGPVGGTYQVERSTLLGSWSEVGEPFVTSGSPAAVSVGAPILLTPRLFWRVRRIR